MCAWCEYYHIPNFGVITFCLWCSRVIHTRVHTISNQNLCHLIRSSMLFVAAVLSHALSPKPVIIIFTRTLLVFRTYILIFTTLFDVFFHICLFTWAVWAIQIDNNCAIVIGLSDCLLACLFACFEGSFAVEWVFLHCGRKPFANIDRAKRRKFIPMQTNTNTHAKIWSVMNVVRMALYYTRTTYTHWCYCSHDANYNVFLDAILRKTTNTPKSYLLWYLWCKQNIRFVNTFASIFVANVYCLFLSILFDLLGDSLWLFEISVGLVDFLGGFRCHFRAVLILIFLELLTSFVSWLLRFLDFFGIPFFLDYQFFGNSFLGPI